MHSEEPFILSKRPNSPFWQVRFKNPDKSSKTRYFTAVSTKEKVYSKAVVKAWSMYNQNEVKKDSVLDSIKSASLSEEDVSNLIQILKEKGAITYAATPQKESSVSIPDFMSNFWDIENSPYIAEKKRMGKHIGVKYVEECLRDVSLYWNKFFENKLLCEVTRKDIKDFIEFLDKKSFGWNRKLKIYRAGSKALKWAFYEEIIDRDITAGIVSFSGKPKPRKILTMELAELLFSVKWDDYRCQLANLVAMLSGMRSGEIQALQVQDLGRNCIYVRHSWNEKEGLKTPKNGEERTVYFPFPTVIERLLKLAYIKSDKLDAFIFFAPFVDDKPMDSKLFASHLKRQMKKLNFPEDCCKDVCFHSWRHFYTTYMSNKVNQRALQSQTGHKTIEMLEHYGNHQIDSDIKQITEAQLTVFASVLKKATF